MASLAILCNPFHRSIYSRFKCIHRFVWQDFINAGNFSDYPIWAFWGLNVFSNRKFHSSFTAFRFQIIVSKYEIYRNIAKYYTTSIMVNHNWNLNQLLVLNKPKNLQSTEEKLKKKLFQCKPLIHCLLNLDTTIILPKMFMRLQ